MSIGTFRHACHASLVLLVGIACGDESPAPTTPVPPFQGSTGEPAMLPMPASETSLDPDEPAAGPAPSAAGTAAAGGNEGPPPVQAPPSVPSEGASAGTASPPQDDAPLEPPNEPVPPAEPAAPPAAQEFPVSAGTPIVYLAGDSTVQTYGAAQAPQQGWGQRIQELFTEDVVFVNKSIGGRSSKSFIDEGRLDEIVSTLERGDYLFAQWGINDRYRSDPIRFTDPSTTFKQYLQMYIDGARSKDAIAVLVTPTPRLDFSNGAFQNGFAEYCAAIKELGEETDTPVIDLQTRGLAYYTSIGLEQVQSTIILDVLHFKVEGAFQMARLVSEGVRESVLPIGQFVK